MNQKEEQAELIKALEQLCRRVLNEDELKNSIRWLESGWSIEAIMLAFKYVLHRMGKWDFHAIDRTLLRWEEYGWTTVEEIKKHTEQSGSDKRIADLLKIKRRLTPAESQYAKAWCDMEMEDPLILAACERTQLNTGGLNWAYMNKILQRWHEQGFRALEDIQKAESEYRKQHPSKDAEIQRLKEENRDLMQKVIELQDALLKEKESVNQLLQERSNENA